MACRRFAYYVFVAVCSRIALAFPNRLLLGHEDRNKLGSYSHMADLRIVTLDACICIWFIRSGNVDIQGYLLRTIHRLACNTAKVQVAYCEGKIPNVLSEHMLERTRDDPSDSTYLSLCVPSWGTIHPASCSRLHLE